MTDWPTFAPVSLWLINELVPMLAVVVMVGMLTEATIWTPTVPPPPALMP